MISIGLDVAVSLAVSIALAVVLGVWFRQCFVPGGDAGIDHDPLENVRQCPYCSRLVVDDHRRELMICPVCKSYFEEER